MVVTQTHRRQALGNIASEILFNEAVLLTLPRLTRNSLVNLSLLALLRGKRNLTQIIEPLNLLWRDVFLRVCSPCREFPQLLVLMFLGSSQRFFEIVLVEKVARVLSKSAHFVIRIALRVSSSLDQL
jgi:hypothetical protein